MNFALFNKLAKTAKMHKLLPLAGCLMVLGSNVLAATVTNLTGLSVTVDTSGNYAVQSAAPAWTFGGSLGVAPTSVATNSRADNIGAYSEITFNYVSGANRSAAIRLYKNSPTVLFTYTYLTGSTNDLAFPNFTTYPPGLNFEIGRAHV